MGLLRCQAVLVHVVAKYGSEVIAITRIRLWAPAH
jgi:hypothetical protein